MTSRPQRRNKPDAPGKGYSDTAESTQITFRINTAVTGVWETGFAIDVPAREVAAIFSQLPRTPRIDKPRIGWFRASCIVTSSDQLLCILQQGRLTASIFPTSILSSVTSTIADDSESEATAPCGKYAADSLATISSGLIQILQASFELV